MLRGNSYKINQALRGYHCIINPAIKETHDRGRARIAVPEGMNTYFPNDPRTANFDDTELIETFAHIKRVIETNDCLLW